MASDGPTCNRRSHCSPNALRVTLVLEGCVRSPPLRPTLAAPPEEACRQHPAPSHEQAPATIRHSPATGNYDAHVALWAQTIRAVPLPRAHRSCAASEEEALQWRHPGHEAARRCRAHCGPSAARGACPAANSLLRPCASTERWRQSSRRRPAARATNAPLPLPPRVRPPRARPAVTAPVTTYHSC